MGIVAPVVGHQSEGLALFLAGQCLHALHLLQRCGLVSLEQLVEKFVDCRSGARHALGQFIGYKVGVSQQQGQLHAGVDQLFDDVAVVCFTRRGA